MRLCRMALVLAVIWAAALGALPGPQALALAESVNDPGLDGPTSGYVGLSYQYTAWGSATDCGAMPEYQFDWGDGQQSGWLPAGSGNRVSAGHSFSSGGTYYVRARARCPVHDAVSTYSTPVRVAVSAAEVISAPGAPYLPSGQQPRTGEPILFEASGAASNQGDPLEYQFRWDDGSPVSDWRASGSATHIYADPCTYKVTARARCQLHPDVISNWSPALNLDVRINETVSPPTFPLGPGVVEIGAPAQFHAEGAVSDLGHGLQYQFDWGDGALSDWGATDASHIYNTLGTYGVCARARCAEHTYVVSDWSGAVQVVPVCGQGTYSLQVGTAGPGTVEVHPDQTTYAAGDSVQLIAIPDAGSAFTGWSGDLTGSRNPTVITINRNMSVVANFGPMSCTLEVVIYPEGGGTVSLQPQKTTYAWGETVQLTASPGGGYEFNHWGGDVFAAANPVQVTLHGDTRVKAIFSPTTSEHFPMPEPQAAWTDLVGTISVCGLPAAPGDEIAVEDPQGTICGQFTVVDPEGFYGILRVWGDNEATPEDEGASPGEALSFVLWDSLEQTEVELEAVGADGAPVTWTGQGDVQVVALATVCQEQIPLTTGWNLVSFRTNRCYYASAEPPAVPLLAGTTRVASSLSDTLASIAGRYQLVRGFDTAGAHTYDPSLPAAVSDLTYLAPGYGYWIKATEPCTLVLEGGRVAPSAGLPLQPGWNLAGCWANEVRHRGEPPAVAFAEPPPPVLREVDGAHDLVPGLAGTYDVVRGFDAAGAHTYDPTLPDFLSDLRYVGPGYGYWLRMRVGFPLGWARGEQW